MGADVNWTWTGSRLQVWAVLRNAAIDRLRLSGSTNIAVSLRRNAARVNGLLEGMRTLTD